MISLISKQENLTSLTISPPDFHIMLNELEELTKEDIRDKMNSLSAFVTELKGLKCLDFSSMKCFYNFDTIKTEVTFTANNLKNSLATLEYLGGNFENINDIIDIIDEAPNLKSLKIAADGLKESVPNFIPVPYWEYVPYECINLMYDIQASGRVLKIINISDFLEEATAAQFREILDNFPSYLHVKKFSLIGRGSFPWSLLVRIMQEIAPHIETLEFVRLRSNRRWLRTKKLLELLGMFPLPVLSDLELVTAVDPGHHEDYSTFLRNSLSWIRIQFTQKDG